MIPCHPIGQAFCYRFLAIGQAVRYRSRAIGQVVRYRFLAIGKAIRYRSQASCSLSVPGHWASGSLSVPCMPSGKLFVIGSLHAIGQVVRYRFRTIGQAAVRYRSRAVGIATGHRSRVPSGSGGGSGLWGSIGSSVDRLYGQTPCHAKIDLYHIAHPGYGASLVSLRVLAALVAYAQVAQEIFHVALIYYCRAWGMYGRHDC